MAIQKAFILRYRGFGYVRFQIPAAVCEPEIVSFLETGLLGKTGVQSVAFFVKQEKLSIRFDEAACDFLQLAKYLFQLVSDAEQQKLFTTKALAVPAVLSLRERLGAKLKKSRANQWVQAKYSDAKETVQAAKIVTKLGMKRPKAFIRDPEQAIINFLNDILVLYLIKIHWKRITQIWIPSPFKYRYEWLAVFYLFFLLMRSRRPKS